MKKIIRLTESDLVRIVKRVISEQVPSWAVGQPMNFYASPDQSDDDPYGVKITSNTDDVWQDYDGNVSMTIASNNFTGLEFSCAVQNVTPGSFTLLDKTQNKVTVYNKTIAEKYFAPQFCSKNQQGKWVPKVENSDFAQIGKTDQQNVAESKYRRYRNRYY